MGNTKRNPLSGPVRAEHALLVGCQSTLYTQGISCCSLLIWDPLCRKACKEQCSVNQLLLLLKKSAGTQLWSQHTGAVTLGKKSLLLVRTYSCQERRLRDPHSSVSKSLAQTLDIYKPNPVAQVTSLHGSNLSAFLVLHPYLYSPNPTLTWKKLHFAAWTSWTCKRDISYKT